MVSESLELIVSDLQTQIDRELIYQDWIRDPESPDRKVWFATLDLAERTLRPKLTQLFILLSNDAQPEDHAETDAAIAISKDTASCRILAILLHIRCGHETLRTYRSQCTTVNWLRDAHLPLELQTACELFGLEIGNKFFQEQFTFCPIKLEEDKEVEYIGTRACCKLPFASRELLDTGNSGVVDRVKIPPGHFFHSDSEGWGAYKQVHHFSSQTLRKTTPNFYLDSSVRLERIRPVQ
jgi:hypothetical protein